MKFDIEHPGVKEFAIVGGATLGVILLWRWWSNRQAGQAGTSSGTTPPGTAAPQPYAGTTPTGLGLGSLLLWMQDHASSSTTTKTTTTKTGGSPKPTTTGAKKMPDLVGQRANFAIGELKSGYGVAASTSPPRNPRLEYVVTGQTPAAGTAISPGSRAQLRVTRIKAPAARAA